MATSDPLWLSRRPALSIPSLPSVRLLDGTIEGSLVPAVAAGVLCRVFLFSEASQYRRTQLLTLARLFRASSSLWLQALCTPVTPTRSPRPRSGLGRLYRLACLPSPHRPRWHVCGVRTDSRPPPPRRLLLISTDAKHHRAVAQAEPSGVTRDSPL